VKLTTREKILLTILLGALCSWLFGCGKSKQIESKNEPCVSVPSSTKGTTDVPFLLKKYAIYNDAYFQNKLKTPMIDMFEENPANMADTMCEGFLPSGGVGCKMHFSSTFTLAPRVADLTLLHEMCHIKMWMKDMDSFGQQVEHGTNWRACMVQLDTEGAFRQILIDNYTEKTR